MIKETMEFLSQYDPEVGATIEKEYHREQRNIELIASENIVSPAVMMAMGTCLTNKYAEGYPGKRYYGGCYCVDETEEIARQRACKLFGAEHANVQPHSGASANLAAFKAMRHLHGYEPRPRRPPVPRQPGQHLRPVLPSGPLLPQR